MSETYYQAVFRDAADAIVILDDDRLIVEANPAAAAMAGASTDALVGRRFDDLLIDAAAEIDEVFADLAARGETKREHRIASPSGSRILECSYRARVRPGRHLCIARDITDRRLLEERLAQAEKIESVGRLAGGIAHDFNNLLTAILGYTELLLARHRLDDPDYPDLAEVQRAGQRAAALTQRLLAFSRKQVLTPREINLNQVVIGLQAMLARLIRADVTLEYGVDSRPAWARIDAHQIEQVILNLVLNARDALPGGGRIRIDTGRVTVAPDEASPAMPAGDYVRLRVADNGVGMSDETRARLFEPFYTTKEVGKGTGLGLASVYGIVQQSNGIILVGSAPGTGTTFTMYFPAVAAVTDDGAVGEMIAVGRSQGETILLVEDEDAVRAIIASALRRDGYQVLEAASAKAAVDLLDANPEPIQLLLSDVVMPDMNGPALAQRLVGSQPSMRVLFISGYADLLVMPRDAANPRVDFLSKPFRASVLGEKVRAILTRPIAAA